MQLALFIGERGLFIHLLTVEWGGGWRWDPAFFLKAGVLHRGSLTSWWSGSDLKLWNRKIRDLWKPLSKKPPLVIFFPGLVTLKIETAYLIFSNGNWPIGLDCYAWKLGKCRGFKRYGQSHFFHSVQPHWNICLLRKCTSLMVMCLLFHCDEVERILKLDLRPGFESIFFLVEP